MNLDDNNTDTNNTETQDPTAGANGTGDNTTDSNATGDTPPIEPATPPEPITPESIETWALNPENRERAMAFGQRLIFTKDAEALRELPSLGGFEDRATAWAIDHQFKAKLLVMKLIGKLS